MINVLVVNDNVPILRFLASMLLKNYRLKLKNDFNRVFKEGKFASREFLTIGCAENKLNNSRFAVIVAKKVSKKAVVRNSVKRKIFEVVRINMDNIISGQDVIFICRPEIKDKKYSEIEAVVLGLLKKKGLLN